jgi:hypothetical protein
MKSLLYNRILLPYKLLLAIGLGCPLASQAQYTPGNLVVLRVGEGTNSLSNASAPTYLDEYTPAGVRQSSILLNATGTANKLTNGGNATSEGLVTLSSDGRYLLAAGYNSEVGVASISSTAATTVARTVARIDANRAIDISTALTDAYSMGNIRGAASTDGTNLFLSGSNAGVRNATLGATTSGSISTTMTNVRVVRIYRGRVYFSVGAGTAPGIYVVDLASNTTSGQTATPFLLTGSGVSSASPYGFVLLDRDPNVPGLDAAYVADDGNGTTSSAGIQKWSFDGTAWTKQGTIGTAYRGLTGTINPDHSVTLYATVSTGAGGNALVAVTDVNAYNAMPSTTAVNVIVPGVLRVALRSVEFAPGTAVVLPVVLSSFTARRTPEGVQLHWATASEANSARFEVERSLDGVNFAPLATTVAAGTSQQPHTYAHLDAAAPASCLYYRLRQVDLNGTAHFSPVTTVGGRTGTGLALSPNPTRESLTFLTEVPTPYTVRNPLGRVVRTGTTLAGANTLAVGELPAGVYLFELQANTGRVVQRFLKE